MLWPARAIGSDTSGDLGQTAGAARKTDTRPRATGYAAPVSLPTRAETPGGVLLGVTPPPVPPDVCQFWAVPPAVPRARTRPMRL